MSVAERFGITIRDAVDARLHPKWTGHLNGVEFQYLKRPEVCSTVIFDNLEYAKRNGIKPVSLGQVMEKLEEQKIDISKIVLFDTPAQFLSGNHFRVGRIDREENEASLVFSGSSGLFDYSDDISPLIVPIDKPFFTGFMAFDYRKNGRAVSLPELTEGMRQAKNRDDYLRSLSYGAAGPKSTYWADNEGKLVKRTEEEEERIRRETRKISQVVEIKGKIYTFKCDGEELSRYKNEFEAGFIMGRIAELGGQEGELAVKEFLKKAIGYFELRGMISSIRRGARSRLQGEFMRLEKELGFPSDNEIVLKFVQDKGILVEPIDS